jgi:hypothetical protein
MQAVMTFRQWTGASPICAASRWSRPRAFFPSFSLIAWCSFIGEQLQKEKGWEVGDGKLSLRLARVEGIMNGQEEWQNEQWKGLRKEMKWLEKEMGATRQEVVSLAKMVKEKKRDSAVRVEQVEMVPRRSEAPAPQLSRPSVPETEEENEIEDFSDMEGLGDLSGVSVEESPPR